MYNDPQNLIKEPSFWSGAPKGDLSSMAMMRPADGDAAKLKPEYEVHHKTFNMSKVEDVEEYTKLRSDAFSLRDGIMEILCERHYDKSTNTIYIDYEWSVATLVPLIDPKGKEKENNEGAVTGAPRTGVLMVS